MNTVYEIVKYELIGKTLYTCKERPDLELRENLKNKGDRAFFEKGTQIQVLDSNRCTYSLNAKLGAFNAEDRLLPYFADVTEDMHIPKRLVGKLEPKTYKNCQLMTEKHGGYLQFWHEPTKKVLRIALNSHIYQPIV